jgi:hypothetical protein
MASYVKKITDFGYEYVEKTENEIISIVPLSLDNKDYQEYLKSLSENS